MGRRNHLYYILAALLALSFLSSSVAKASPPDAPGYSLSASPISPNRNETFLVNWTRPAGAGEGYIGLYDSLSASPEGYVDFRYPDPSGTSGVVAFLAPDEPGAYWLRWVSGGQIKATQYVGIQLRLSDTMVTLPGYSLSVPNAPAEPGGELVVNWVKPAGAGLGYIGIYETEEDGVPGGGPGEGVGSYLDFRYATGGDSGSVTFIAPDEPASYWLAWVSSDDADYKAFVSFAVAGEGGGGPADGEAPTVSLTAPADGDTVSGTAVTVSADADDNVGVVGVQFQLDGVNLGDEVTSAPYSMVWNAATASNGAHVLTAVARDEAGNQTTSSEITVNNLVSLPEAFAKIGPANGAIGEAHVPSLSWGDSSGAANYEYCVDTSNNNSCDTNWIGVAGAGAFASGLNAGTTYFWQVRAHNAAGTVEADNNVWWSFTTTVSSHVNVALAANGAGASASSFYDGRFAPGGAIDGDRKGVNWGNGGGWNDGTVNTFPDWLQVNFAGPQTIDEVDVFTVQDDYGNPVEPALGMPFTLYGLTGFQIQYWDGLSWAIVPGGDIAGNNQVWTQIQFGAITTEKIRIYVGGALNSYSRITEVEAYADLNVPPSPPAKISPANGASGVSPNPPLSWGAGSGAASYEYCVDTTNNNSCDTAWSSTAGLSAQVNGLSAGTAYFWQVRARNANGVTEADSGAWWNFTTASGGRVNVAAAANGGVASASSFYNSGYAPDAANNGDRKGLNWGNGGGWNDATANALPDWLQVDFAGPQTINEVDVITLQDNYANPVEPALGMPFTLYGVTAFEVQYWNGLAWVDVPGGNITGNNQVWRQISFGNVTTSSIRVQVNGALASYSRITEVEAYSDLSSGPPPNVAAAANGATATASSTYDASFAPGGAINGDRKGLNWGSNVGWNDATADLYPDVLQINFAGAKTIGEIDIFTLQDNFLAPVDPTPSTTFTKYGITDFQVQYWDGANWVNVPNGSISGNNLVWRKISFPALTTTSIRINVTGALTTFTRIIEVEAY